jgi:hypothetical protein
MWLCAFLTGAESCMVLPCLGQAESPIWAAADQVGIVVVLAVVFPIADRADFKPAAFMEGGMATAGAPESLARDRPFDHGRIVQAAAVVVKPLFAPGEFFGRWFLVVLHQIVWLTIGSAARTICARRWPTLCLASMLIVNGF